MNVCQMNLLAPVWLGEMYKLLPCYDRYASKDRLSTSLSYLISFDSDIYILSEVQEQDLPQIRATFGLDWNVVYASHEHGFWKEWLEGREWISNGTSIVVRKSQFESIYSRPIHLGNGCVASSLTCKHTNSKLLVSIVSLHLDTTENKWLQAENLLAQIAHPTHSISIVAGDFNYTDVSMFTSLGYVESATDKESTPIPQGRIDHTLVLGARKVVGTIHSLGDACSTVHTNGSDHYATTSQICL